MHLPIPIQGFWLKQVVTGHFAYYAVPTNARALSAFRHYVTDLWRRTLRRRSQKDGFTWTAWRSLPMTGFPSLASFILGLTRASPSNIPEVGAGCLNWACPDLCGGAGNPRPTAKLDRVWEDRVTQMVRNSDAVKADEVSNGGVATAFPSSSPPRLDVV